MSVAQPPTDTPAPVRTTKETHPNLPPGLILGPDGKPCKVCNSWQDWAGLKMKKKSADEGQGVSGGKGAGAGAAAGMSAFAGMMSGATASKPAPPIAEEKPLDRSDCPPDTAQLGRSTWTFLHTTAAYYPLSAPTNTQTQMLNLLSSLSLLYPCSWCATDFRKDMGSNPPDVSGREGLMKWLCERHNEVNLKLGKERFGCEVKNLDERWKDGPADGRCD
ncbi:mitochondrial FAD-linked sulfhydryl oxidase ERV1 [Cryptococcus wingfieldii CBS 7118]|uniref:Sulfhydryl oxidase n=1 Tax=Cryptococcus wingfieldii CBS 7118 TaxID=1295528 RepID=A0A1E3J2W7_9TREE|nr:mitochondrial FAD-linked sulfhydryl oxidase ERV1 [Cryptococcus wingfieldii CBS 7118]ODN95198.1 mitochondrial FAD-linked sulfhydryl oxidase ERV1 [Cryptococcus wingfieldii CBS 7118]